MHNPLSTQTVIDELRRLLTAFPRRGVDISQTSAIYKGALVGVETDAFRGAVERCIREDEFFPKVARLRALAEEWMRANRGHFAPAVHADRETCGICGARVSPRSITRPMLTKPDHANPKTWHYALPDGRKIAAGDLHALALVLPLLELETVPSRSLYMDHDPRMHHVTGEAVE